MPIVMGRATAYLLLSMGVLLSVLYIVMPLFGIPVRGNVLSVFVFMTPFILSIVFMGIALLHFFERRENAIMLIMYTSLPAVVLTGFSWVWSAMPQWLHCIAYLVPTTLGAKGFVSLTQLEASLTTILPFWGGMWLLCIFYLILASLTMRRLLR